MKPISYTKIPETNDIDLFIEAKFKLAYAGRVSTKKMNEAYEQWRRETTDQDYVMSTEEKIRVDNGFQLRFLPAPVFTGKQSDHGFFGITLNDDQSFVGFKLCPALKKKILKIDLVTKKIVETYDSLTSAAKTLNRTPGQLCTDIKYKKPLDNYIYQYAVKTKNKI